MSGLAPSAALSAFAAVFPAELPDKTMVATIVLATRFRRPLAVWCGVAVAFLGHVTLAATAGGLLARLDDRVVAGAAGALFAVGAAILWRESRSKGDGDVEEVPVDNVPSSFRRTALTSFGVVGLAELGDLTQLATAAVAARTGEPVSVGLGAVAALWSVGAIGAFGGQWLSGRLPVHRLHQIAAVVFAVLAAVSFREALG